MSNAHTLPEISSQNDVDQLVSVFYGKALNDELLAPHFAGIDLEHHLPRMIGFWSLILLDKEGYKGNVFDKHAHLAIGEPHFTRWVALFSQTVDELFSGDKAELAKQRAKLLAYTFASKMENKGN